MSDESSARCAYTYSPQKSPVENDRVNVPRPEHEQCPHVAVDTDSHRCIYHQGESDYPSERFTGKFLETLAQEDRAPTFAGGQLPGLALSGETVTTATGAPLDLRGAVIDGTLDLTDATIEVPLLLDSAAITGSLLLERAEFHGPVSLSNADINGRVHGHDASISGGIDATGIDAGYVDLRAIDVDGAVVLDQASFASNLIIANAAIAGDFSASDASCDWSLDATAVTVHGEFILTGVSIGADLDVVATEIDADAELRKAAISGETDWSHTTIGGDFVASDATFGDDAIFDDLSTDGEAMVFNRTEFDAIADFATITIPESRLAFTDAVFADEIWLTHATIGEMADFSHATFDGMSHLRDASFEDDLVLQGVETTGQFFLHNSVIAGELDCTEATFEHFQFSATAEGKADFSRAEFVEKAIFKSSTFGDRVWFDNALFAGHADFTDTRFTNYTTFNGTEFLVDPTFTDARFAIDPDFTKAEFPFAESIDFKTRRSQMVLVHPDSLQNTGITLSPDDVAGNITIPAETAHLVQNNATITKQVVTAIADYEQSDWHKLTEEALRTARTAVAELPTRDDAVLVFGLRMNSAASTPNEFLTEILLAGVYTQDKNGSFVFSHLDPDLVDTDYLLPIPASDDGFSSGAAVAVASELQQAAVRHEMFRTMLLDKQEHVDNAIHGMLAPLLVGVGKI